jgi:hypothetical protein
MIDENMQSTGREHFSPVVIESGGRIAAKSEQKKIAIELRRRRAMLLNT